MKRAGCAGRLGRRAWQSQHHRVCGFFVTSVVKKGSRQTPSVAAAIHGYRQISDMRYRVPRVFRIAIAASFHNH